MYVCMVLKLGCLIYLDVISTSNEILAYFKPHLGNTLIFDDLLFVEKLEKLFPKYLNIVLFYHKLKVIIYSEKLHLDSVRLLRI